MTMTPDSALEAFAHRFTEEELVKFLKALSESGKERLRACGHLALPLALKFNKDSSLVLKILLDSSLGIQVNVPDQDGNTVLHVAVILEDTQAVSLLLDRSDIISNVRDRHGDTPVHVAVAKASSPDARLTILDSLLSDSRTNVFAVNAQKRNVLHVACMSKHSHVDVIRKVLRSVARSVKNTLLSPDESGRTALHYAAINGRQEIVDEILSCSRVNEDVDSDPLVFAEDATGNLAVDLAAQHGHLPVVKRLLKYFKDDQKGLPLLRCAIRSGRNDVVELCLKEYTISPTEYLELLSLTTHLNIADFLLVRLHCALVNGKASTMSDPVKSLMQWAVEDAITGALVIPHVLNSHPHRVNEVLNDLKGQTALHISTIAGNVEAVKVLCSEGAPWDLHADTRDLDGLTALDYAFKKKNKAVQRILMKCPDVRQYLAQLHKNREAYVKASNAILVVAALIAALTYAKCSTDAEIDKKLNLDGLAPSPSTATGKNFLDHATTPPKLAFFLATLSCLLAAIASLPFSFGLVFVQTTDDNYVRQSSYKTRVLVVMASYCLVLSLGAVLVSFICSQFILPFVAFDCDKACRWALFAFVCLSVVLLSANAVTAFIGPVWKKNQSWRLSCRDSVNHVLSIKHFRIAKGALDKEHSQELVNRATEEAGDVKYSLEV